jgi:hypothetical protein
LTAGPVTEKTTTTGACAKAMVAPCTEHKTKLWNEGRNEGKYVVSKSALVSSTKCIFKGETLQKFKCDQFKSE